MTAPTPAVETAARAAVAADLVPFRTVLLGDS